MLYFYGLKVDLFNKEYFPSHIYEQTKDKHNYDLSFPYLLRIFAISKNYGKV
jgi:hypothetical protein